MINRRDRYSFSCCVVGYVSVHGQAVLPTGGPPVMPYSATYQQTFAIDGSNVWNQAPVQFDVVGPSGTISQGDF